MRDVTPTELPPTLYGHKVDWTQYNRDLYEENRAMMRVIIELVRQVGGSATITRKALVLGDDRAYLVMGENFHDLTWTLTVRVD